MTSAPRFSVIVPCYNEEGSLPGLAQRLARLREELAPRGDLEVVLVDDGSADATAGVAERLFGEWPAFRLVRHPRNLGLGAAFATGIGAARGALIGTVDADGSYDPLLLAQLFARIDAGADLATASPYHPQGEVAGVGGLRLLLSRGVSRLYGLVLPQHLYTYTSCFRAYRAEVAREVAPSRPGFDAVAEMLCAALLRGYRVAEVPARLATRTQGVSKLRIGREIAHHLRNLTQIALRRGPFAPRASARTELAMKPGARGSGTTERT
jgi:dolichol-phosphate mannosyltransferase